MARTGCGLVLWLAALAFPAAAWPAQMDSLEVVQRYGRALDSIKTPPAVIFQYAVSQEGASNIEQRHQVYRSGTDVRDETIAVDGAAIRQKIVRVGQREDRYAAARISPRAAGYNFIFLRTVKNGARTDYVYETAPIEPATTGYWVSGIAIDSKTFLPHLVRFKSVSGNVTAAGVIEYAVRGPYVVPVAAGVSASVNGKPAREHISFDGYRFPPALPASTFVPPQQLPHTILTR